MITVSTNSFAQAAQINTHNFTSPPIPQLTIATHNVRSFTNVTKQNIFIELYLSLDIDIMDSKTPISCKHTSTHSISPLHPNFMASSVLLYNRAHRRQNMESVYFLIRNWP